MTRVKGQVQVMLDPETLPIHSRDVVARKDSDGMLLFQVRTDEMHFISKDAFTLFSLCDGSRTVIEIEELLECSRSELATLGLRAQIEQFIERLAERNIVELWR